MAIPERLKQKMDEQQLELLYNQKDICEAFFYKGEQEAIALLEAKAETLRALPEEDGVKLRLIFLTSLNRSLYNYLLFDHGVSLGACCYENFRQLSRARTAGTFLEAGRQIIRTYGALTRALPPGRERPRTPSAKKIHLVQACHFIDTHLSEPLTLQKVAQAVYVSPSYLCQLFKEEKAETFSAYLTSRRMEAAKQLLLGSQLSVDEVAARCGYGSSSYFSTVFRKQTGVSPRAFRRSGAGAQGGR